MVIRRFREHVAEHNWFAVTVDVGIVVLGVFLGAQVTSWNQDRLDRQQGHDYRLRLIDELTANQADMLDRRRYYSSVRDHARRALAALATPGGSTDARLLIDAYEASQITPRKTKRFTYDEILARGALQWVGDAKLREQISNYYVGVETGGVTFNSVPPYREHIREVMPAVAQDAVRRDCPERIYFTVEGAALARLAQNCTTLRLDPETAAAAAATVRASPGIEKDLTRLIADLDVKIGLADVMVGHRSRVGALIVAADKAG